MEIISSKNKKKKATTSIVNILKLRTNPKVLIQEFLWSFEVLITDVLDYITSMPVPFKRHLFCQNPMYNCRVISIEI